jgi:HNH endonuclease
MADLPEEIKRAVWRRDGYRCQECGVAVAQRNGCKPQTHHRKPKSAGGTNGLDNLITLCITCHATKDSPGHKKLFLNATPEETPSYIKWCLWELSTDLLVYAENLSPLNFPAPQVLDRLKQLRDALDSVTQLTLTAIQERPLVTANKGTDPDETPEVLEAIVHGLKLSYWSRHYEEVLNEEVRGPFPA